MGEHKKNLIKLIQQASYKHSTWQIFSDFVELAALSISNSVDKTQYEEREKRYIQIIKTYDRKEAELFPKMFTELIQALEAEKADILGEIFMELELGSKWKGQFFTPMSVCRAMASMMLSGVKEQVEEKGFITVNEPAAGGGSLIIALADRMEDLGINYQQSMEVTAMDIDIKAVHMCYVQLSLLGIPAVVCHGNTLLVEVYSQWETPTYILGGWWYKKQRITKRTTVKTMGEGPLKLVV